MATTNENVNINLNLIAGEAMNSLRGMKKELRDLQDQMTAAGKSGDTQLFDKLQRRFAIMRNDIKDTSKAMNYLDPGELLSGYVKFGQGVTGAFAAVTASLSIFGNESETVQKIQKKSTEIIQLMIGLEQARQVLIDRGGRAEIKQIIATTVEQDKTIARRMTEALTINTVEGASKSATGAQRIWNAVVAANPIMFLVAAVAALAIGIYLFTKSTEEDTETQKKNAEERQKTIDLLKEQEDVGRKLYLQAEQLKLDMLDEGPVKKRAQLLLDYDKTRIEAVNSYREELKKAGYDETAIEEKTVTFKRMLREKYDVDLRRLNEGIHKDETEKARKIREDREKKDKEAWAKELEDTHKRIVLNEKRVKEEEDAERELAAVKKAEWQKQNALYEYFKKRDADALDEWNSYSLSDEEKKNKAELDAIDHKYARETEYYNGLKALGISDTEITKRIEEEKTKITDKSINERNKLYRESALKVASELKSLFDELTSIQIENIEREDVKWQKSQERRMTQLKNNSDIIKAQYGENSLEYIASLESMKQADLQKIAHDEQVDADKKDAAKRYADFQFALTTASIIANTAEAVMNAWTTKPAILAVLQAAAAGLSGITQLAAANAQRNSVKSMAQGGDVNGAPHSGGGVMLNAEGGEFVVNKKSMGIPAFRSIVSSINVAGGGVPSTGSNAIGGSAAAAPISATVDVNSIRDIVREIAAIPVVVSESDITKTQRKITAYETISKY